MINFNKRNIRILSFVITSILFLGMNIIFEIYCNVKVNNNLQNQSISILDQSLNPKNIVNQNSKNENLKNENSKSQNKNK